MKKIGTEANLLADKARLLLLLLLQVCLQLPQLLIPALLLGLIRIRSILDG
jgi:hypothetical protein